MFTHKDLELIYFYLLQSRYELRQTHNNCLTAIAIAKAQQNVSEDWIEYMNQHIDLLSEKIDSLNELISKVEKELNN